MRLRDMGMRQGVGWFFAALLLFGVFVPTPAAYGGTFFVFVEEKVDGEFLLEDVSPVSEGLLLGLFDRGHIVFDDNGMEPGFPWEGEDFSRFLETGRQGGAEYFIAVKVDTTSHPPEASEGTTKAVRYSSVIKYYCFEVLPGKLLAKGDLAESSEGAEGSPGRVDFGMQLGSRLSASVEGICLGERELASGEGEE